MRTVSQFGPFRTAVREAPGPGRTAVCVRIDRVNENGERLTPARDDVHNFLWLSFGLPATQAEEVTPGVPRTACEKGGAK